MNDAVRGASAPRRTRWRAEIERVTFPDPRGQHPPYSAIEIACITACLAAFVALAIPLIVHQSAAYDEGPHILSGYQYLVSGRFSGGVSNPPLGQLLLAAATVFRGDAYRPFDPAALPYARAVPLACACATALLVWRGARRHAGPLAGLAGVALFVVEPTVLGHSTLATLDVIAMTAGTFATYALWRVCSRPTLSTALLAGAFVGAALGTKFSLIALIPGWFVASVWPIGAPHESESAARRRVAVRVLSRSAALAVVCVMAWAVVCTLYLWRGVLSPSVILSDARGLLLGVFPEPFARSFVTAGAHASGGHFAYLSGARSATGFAQYFLVAACLKWTIAFLTVLSIGFAWMLSRRRWPARAEMFLLAPCASLLVVASVVSQVDIGVRHLLPMMPLACVLGGVTLVRLARRGRMPAIAAIVLLTAHVGESLAAWPHSLAFFNVVAGGPTRGDRFLIDSNVDWGTEEHAVRAALAHDSSLVLLPDPRDPAPGRALVNVNALRGLFDLAGTPYWWLAHVPPDSIVSPAWRVYSIERGMTPPRDLDAAHRALLLAVVTDRAEWARVLVNPAVQSPDASLRAAGLLLQARASRALGEDAAAFAALDSARGAWDDRFAAEDARIRARQARGGHAAYYRGRALALAGDHTGAVRAYREAAADPASARAGAYGLAMEAVHRGALAASESLLSSGARPPDGSADWLLRSVRTARALRASPRATDHVQLARWFAGRGAIDAAFDEAEVALALDGACEPAIGLMGQLAIDEKCGRVLFERHGADRGFVLSTLRRGRPVALRAVWDSASVVSATAE